MESKSRKVTIEGLPPGILMHAFPMQPIPGFEKMEPEEQAKHAEYRTPEGKLHVPGINIQRAFVNGGKFVKGKGRASLMNTVAACVFVSPPHVILNKQKYEIDSRPVVNPTTKGRIIRNRPWFQDWKLSFEVEWDPTLISDAQMREVVDHTGSRVGILDFRPACKGPFGRFIVTHWTD